MVLRFSETVLEFVLGAAKNSHPFEFAGLLRAKKDLVYEVLIIPGTTATEHSAALMQHMVPIDPSIVGSVHSHPSFSNKPSQADLVFFRKTGKIHLIVCMPYSRKSIAAYDSDGNPLEVSF